MEGGERSFEPVSLSELRCAVEESDYSATVSSPRYTEIDFDGPGVNWTGDGTYVTEASLVLDGRGPEITVNMSADRERMWYEVPSGSYQDDGREALREFAELLGVGHRSEDEGKVYTWEDFAGYPEVKENVIQDVVWPMENPELFDSLDVETSHVLLYGPPGTGKTLLGNVIADETDSKFYHVTIGEVINSKVGESEEYIQDLFEEARETAPSILFIDELEAFGRDRDDQTTSTGKNVVNTSLSELDGLNGNSGVTAIGTTNRPESLDDAFTRSGRFSQDYEIGRPDTESREAIFDVHLAEPGEEKGSPAVAGIDYGRLAEEAEELTGADISSAVEEASKQQVAQLMQEEEITDVKQVSFQNYENSLRLSAEDIIHQIE
ncbi:MAG: 26S protease regulatory subunit [Candidatus Nanosalina sp.]